MFASMIETGRLPGGCPLDEANVEVEGEEPPLPDGAPPVEDTGPLPWSRVAPSGWLGLELDQRTDRPQRLSDAELVEAIVGFEHVASWAGARQAGLLAEFTRRRPAIEDERAERRVEVGPESDGMASLWAWLSGPDASAAYERLGQLARELGADDPRGMDARRADLLVELLTGRRCGADGSPVPDDQPDEGDPDAGGPWCATEDDVTAEPANEPAEPDTAPAARAGHACRPGPRAGKPLVHVVVPITMLLGLDHAPGELVGHGPIPAETAREIAAHGTWRRLLTDPRSGALLDVGHTRYRPPESLARHVRARDLACRQPVCDTPAVRGDLDHIVPWPDGPTSEDNLHPPCRHHHRTKTLAPGWQVTRKGEGTITWTTPTGHSDASQPHDYREQLPKPRPG